LLAEARHSLSRTRRSLRNQTTAARRSAAELEGSRGRLGPRDRGAWIGVAEREDLKEVLEGVGEAVERERWVRDEAWVGTLTLLG